MSMTTRAARSAEPLSMPSRRPGVSNQPSSSASRSAYSAQPSEWPGHAAEPLVPGQRVAHHPGLAELQVVAGHALVEDRGLLGPDARTGPGRRAATRSGRAG